jgi:hypothetical protein
MNVERMNVHSPVSYQASMASTLSIMAGIAELRELARTLHRGAPEAKRGEGKRAKSDRGFHAR